MDPRPNRFAAALRTLTEQPGHSLTSIAKCAGISLGDLSRIRAGKDRVSRGAMQRLADNLESRDAVPLLLAYLRDEIPPHLEPNIRILSETSIIAEPTEQYLTRWQRALNWVTTQEANPSIAEWLITTSELIQGLAPTYPSEGLTPATGRPLPPE